MTAPSLREMVSALIGLPCWYVSCGGAAGSSFQLALGAKTPRDVPVRNPHHSEEYRRNEGEANLLVWCSWRLDGPDRPMTSSDDGSANQTRFLEQLAGETISAVELRDNCWDLTLTFGNGYRLAVFCDHVGKASFNGNWELWTT